jgi:SAM-dependent methyltransferase
MPMAEAVYDSFIAEYYDSSPVVVGRRQDVAFYRDAARKFCDPVLELGCGTGRIALAIAEAGHSITGLDIAERMLERAEKRRAALPAEIRDRVRFTQGDMTRFDLVAKFRLIIIPFRPFQHLLETQQQIDCLESVRKHLAAGGRLIIDFFQTDAGRMHDPAFHKEHLVAEYDMPGERHVRLTEHIVAFHRALQRNDVEMIYQVTHRDGRTERLPFAFTLRYFFRFEVEHLLARCGFRVTELYGNFDSSPLRDDSPEMIFVSVLAR